MRSRDDSTLVPAAQGRHATAVAPDGRGVQLRLRQGQYAVIGVDGQILKRGNDLKQVLRVLERKLIRVVD